MKKFLSLVLLAISLLGSYNSFILKANARQGADKAVQSVIVQSDNKMVLYGSFKNYNNQPCGGIIRLNPDGKIDSTFKAGTGINNIADEAIKQPDDKILIIGTFSEYNGTKIKKIVRLNQDGSLDESFSNSNEGMSGLIYAIKLQTDGKIVVTGSFTKYGDFSRNGIVRLNTDGSLDQTFDPQVGPQFNGIRNGVVQKDVFYEAAIHDFVIQPDGKIVIVGTFTSFNKVPQKYIARLNSDGSLDSTFKSGVGPSGDLERIFIQPDGRLLIVGEFISYDREPVIGFARLNQDGSLDKSFKPELDNFVEAAAFYSNGDILLGGSFTKYNKKKVDKIVKINSQGVLDENFSLINKFNGRIHSIAIRPDNQIAVGGSFTQYNGQEANNFLLIKATPTSNIVTGTTTMPFITPTSSPVCVDWTYGEWGECINGRQSRRITSTYPGGCSGGSPVLTKTCGSEKFDGQFIKVPQTTEVYFIDNQKVKHSLSSQIFNSYFSQTKPPVKTVSIEEAAQYSLGQNIYFNKNTLIKIKGFSRVYRVTDSETGQLIWIKDEILAKKLYGHSWAKAIYEIDESVFIDYKLVDDSDNDGLSDLEEKFLGTDPQKNDTDNDSYLDGQEVFFGHNPLL